MSANSWFQKLNPFRGNGQVKALQEQLDEITDKFQAAEEYHVKFLDSEPGGFASGGSNDLSGIEQQIDIASLQRVYCTETWVYNAVTTIAETIAGLPIKLEKSKKIAKTVTNEVTGAQEQVESIVWTDASGEKLMDAFLYPNKYTTKTEFVMLMVIDLLTAGEYYLHLDADEGVDLTTIEADPSDNDPNSPFGRLRSVMAAEKPIKAMYRIPPSIIKPVMSEDKRTVAGYAMQTEDGVFPFSAAEIIHVKLPNPMDQFRGLSPLIAVFKPVLIDRFTTEHMIRFFKSGARLGGVIETDKTLNKEQLARFQRSFENNYTGRQNHHRTLILPPGMEYKAIEQNPAETALLEFCKYNREAILATYKVPPIKMGIVDGSSYANAYAQLKTFYNDCVKPKLSFIQDGYNLKSCLMPDNRSFRMMFDLSQVDELQEDNKTTAEQGKYMLDSGMTVNEVRKKIWKLGPIKGGDKSPVVEKMENPSAGFPLPMMRAAAPGDIKDGRNPEQTAPTDIKPTQGTYADRVNELVGQMVASGIPLNLAIPKAMEQARLEGFTDAAPAEAGKLSTAENSVLVQTNVGDGKPCECAGEPDCDCDKKLSQSDSLSQYLVDALAKLDPNESVDPDFIKELVALYHEQHAAKAGAMEKPMTEETGDEEIVDLGNANIMRRHAVDKATAGEQWKSFIRAADPMIEKRLAAVRKFFKQFEQIVVNRFGANIKSYGLHKARDNDDIDDILDIEAFQDLIKSYVKQIDDALADAYKYGYDTTLANFTFGSPSEAAGKFLEAYGAKSVTSITETTRDQLRATLKDAFERGLSAGDVSKAIREKFEEIDQGRAVTIARTETLTAVSAGREEKRTDWQEKFPDKKLKKQWISAQDDRVRDSHVEVDGEVVDVDAKFSNGLAYPREAGAPAEEVINCFYERSLRVLTDKGWKPIGDIKPGDMVKTHAGGYQPVERTLNDKVVIGDGRYVEFEYEINGLTRKMKCTPSHRWMTQRGWVEAKDLTPEDSIAVDMPACPICGMVSAKNSRNVFSGCSRSCVSKSTAARQWKNEAHRKSVAEKTTNQLHREYENGTRDAKKITLAANQRVKDLTAKGMQHKKSAAGENHWSRKHPAKFASHLENLHKSIYRKGGNRDEKKFGDFLVSIGVNAEPQVKKGPYIIDFLIENKAIEFNGDYWHRLPGAEAKDARRKAFLKNAFGIETLEIWASEFRCKTKHLRIAEKVRVYLRGQIT